MAVVQVELDLALAVEGGVTQRTQAAVVAVLGAVKPGMLRRSAVGVAMALTDAGVGLAPGTHRCRGLFRGGPGCAARSDRPAAP